MPLEMTVLRCPDAVPPETRVVSGGEFSVGRGPGVDWVLPDPERLLSKRHFALAFRAGTWQLADTSTNGTFLNTADTALGSGEVRALRDGDRLRLGAYEIEVRLTEEAPRYGATSSSFGAGGRGGDSFGGDPFSLDPLAPPPPAHVPFGDRSSPRADVAPILPDDDFDLLGPGPIGQPASASFGSMVQSDHSSVMQDAFQPPAPAGMTPMHTGGTIPGDDLLPDDWDNDLLEGIGAPAAQPMPPPPAPAPPPIVHQPPPDITPPPVSTTNDDISPFAEPGDLPQGVHRLGAHRLGEPIAHAAPPVTSVFDLPVDPPRAPPSATPEPLAAPRASEAGLLTAFMEGAGLPDLRPADPEATMRALGSAFRATVAGLRAVLIARASVKSEFRIEQTMIRARGNNPLKFSAGDDDALEALLGTGRRVDMAPAAAVTDALKDIRLHELASMSAMQSAVRALMEGLDPAKLRAAADQGGGLAVLPAQRKARAWDAFEALHTKTIQALSDDFDSIFGKAFARAYERAMDDISAKERE